MLDVTIRDALRWFIAHPEGVVPLALFLVFLVCAIRRRMPAPRDPRRAFTSAQRAAAFQNAGDRCEYTTVWNLRCRGRAEHADHLYPWSRGGATTLRNCVAACAPCNLAKSDRVLPRWRVRMIVRRRRRYFPEGVGVRLGERYDEALAPARGRSARLPSTRQQRH